jgi:hypothetical protein
MIRSHLYGALASVAVALVSVGAAAQSSTAAQTKDPANTNTASHAADKTANSDKMAAAGKADPKDKGADPAAKEADHAARLKAQHDLERQQLVGVLHGPITEGVRQDLRQHAERVAKLERIRALALDAKDSATVDRATKLLEKENARYEKWMSTLSTKTDTAESSKAKAGAQ